MNDLHRTASSLEIEKRWEGEVPELDIDDNISCETGLATVLASNKRTNATVSSQCLDFLIRTEPTDSAARTAMHDT